MNLKTYQYLARYSLGKRGAIQAYRSAINNQFLSEDELSELSWLKTQKLLSYAFKNVPWYNRKFTEVGLHPLDIKNPEDYNQVPILRREDIKENFELFISKEINPNSLKISTTGGSTGTPLKIGMSKNGIRELPKWQMYSWWGLNPRTNMASIYRGIPANGIKKVALNLISWPQKKIQMDATQMSRKKIEEFILKMNKVKPQLIHGYVGAIDTIADYILENNISVPAPKVLWVTAAPITTIQEKKINKAFRAPVCNQYGCSELYFVSAECQHKTGLHIFSDSVKVEILTNNNEVQQPNKYGKIVLTNLDEYHFPLIRYENGDTGRILTQKCTCGMTLPLMDKVKGRISDNIELPDGTILAGEYLTTIFDDYSDFVKQFQIIQSKDKNIRINVVIYPDKKVDEILTIIKKTLVEKIHNQVKISINIVDHISVIKGKLRFIVKE